MDPPTRSGDGEAFRGRGFVQLTGRDNYARYGEQIGVDLLKRPNLANEPEVAAHLLARFLKEREAPLRHALASDNLAAARRLVNGGQHGLNRFSDTIRRGQPASVASTSPAERVRYVQGGVKWGGCKFIGTEDRSCRGSRRGCVFLNVHAHWQLNWILSPISNAARTKF